MPKDAFYFSHDSNARNDPKMIRLRRMGGLEYVGMYWCVIEMLREAKNHELDVESIEDICYELRIDEAKFESLFICDLLKQDEKIFFSPSLKDRMKKREKIRTIRAKSGMAGGTAQAKVKQNTSKTEAKEVQKNAGKERKGKEILKENKEENNIPTLDVFQKYAKDNFPDVDSKLVELKYKAWVTNRWKDGNDNEVKNWKTKLLHTVPHLVNNNTPTKKERRRNAFA